ncbi:RNA-binding domain-containing protein [Corynespora cassiicola Philippines]|uniref:RNA-binding domain-containing protein n=1 Tax=Corynespora cassiicola Philippines TaxID=1448308 RepID=A0A2T2P013_CORCC|nr:RNA-binding domain-containing protein [Corynespora cassiicola Philippines]
MAANRHWYYFPSLSEIASIITNHREQNKEATVYVGNLHENMRPDLLAAIFNQHGVVRNVNMPIDRVNGKHQGFGFVEFSDEAEAAYAEKIMNQIPLFGSRIRVNRASADKQKATSVGAELFIGQLDQMVTEKDLYEVFVNFGQLIGPPKIARDDVGISKGYGFVSYADFESSDAAIAKMNGVEMMGKPISVQYAFKRDGKGERHGDEAERMLAAQGKAHGILPEANPLNPALFQPVPVIAPPGVPMGVDSRGVPGAPHAPAGFGRAPSTTPLPPPPHGLPARPPSGAPSNMYPPPTGFPPGPPGPPGGFAPRY